MSLQPGPFDPSDSSSLNPPPQDGSVPPPPAPEPPAAEPPIPGSFALPGAGQAPPPPVGPSGGVPYTPPSGPPPQAWPPSAPPAPAPTPQYGQYPPSAPPPAQPAPGTGQGYPPPAQPGYPPAAYTPAPATGYQGYQSAPQTESKAIVGLILAIASWVICPVVLAIIALVLASQSNKAIAASAGRFSGHGMNTATKWISWVNIVLSIIGLLIFAGFMIFAVSNPQIFETPAPLGSLEF